MVDRCGWRTLLFAVELVPWDCVAEHDYRLLYTGNAFTYAVAPTGEQKQEALDNGRVCLRILVRRIGSHIIVGK